MDVDLFRNMEAPKLGKYIEFVLRNYRVVDAFWFIKVAEHFGQEANHEDEGGI